MATITTADATYPWRPDVTTFHATDVVPDALILQTATLSGTVDGDAPSVRVAYVTDDDADFVAEAELIPDADPGLSEVVVHTGKISQLVPLSSEQYGQNGTAEQLAASMSRAIVKRADQAYLAQVAPTPPAVTPPAGIQHVSGIVPGGTIAGDLDALVDLIAILQDNGSVPSHIVTDPLGWAELRKLRVGTDYNSSLLGAGTTDAAPMLLSLPVLVNRHAPDYGLFVLDSSAVVSAVGPVNIATSEHAAFRNDAVLVRATWRIGWNIVRPERIGHALIAEPGS